GAAGDGLGVLDVGEAPPSPAATPLRADRHVEGRARGGAARAGEGAGGRGARNTLRTPRAISAGLVARSTSASPSIWASLGSGRGVHGSVWGTDSGSRAASKSTVVMSTPETPSTRAWWVF